MSVYRKSVFPHSTNVLWVREQQEDSAFLGASQFPIRSDERQISFSNMTGSKDEAPYLLYIFFVRACVPDRR